MLKQNRCKSCGRACIRRYCDPCSKNRKKTGGLSQTCALCLKLDECGGKDERVRSACIQCGQEDNCNILRGGLCLDCYAKKYCEEHPLSALSAEELLARRKAMRGENWR